MNAAEALEEIRQASAELAWRDNDALVMRIDQILIDHLGRLDVPIRMGKETE